MKSRVLIPAAIIACLSLAAAPAHAGSRSRDKDDKKDAAPVVKAVSPSLQAPPLPPVEKPAEVVPASTFPMLPPSRPCVAEDLRGNFKLAAIYEEPVGEETSAFKASPNQYLVFRGNSTFMKANMGNENVSIEEVLKQMREHSSGLSQFLVQDNGFVYFYLDSVAVDVKACFIVSGDKVPFKNGQMILMPPKGQIPGRLVKLYDRIKREEDPISASVRAKVAADRAARTPRGPKGTKGPKGSGKTKKN